MKCCEAGEEYIDYDILRMLKLKNKKQKLRLGHFDNWVDGYVNHSAGIHQRKIRLRKKPELCLDHKWPSSKILQIKTCPASSSTYLLPLTS